MRCRDCGSFHPAGHGPCDGSRRKGLAVLGMAMAAWALLLVLVSMAGCAAPRKVVRTVEVKIPVPVRREPPPELLKPYLPEALPVFLPPGPESTSCLSQEGERRLKAVLFDLLARERAWRAWASE